jgi:hypothetical protein
LRRKPSRYRLVSAEAARFPVTVPQRRAMGFGAAMTQAERDAWADRVTDLFLDGCRGISA